MRRDGIFDSDEWLVFGINNFWNAARDAHDALRSDLWFELHQITPDENGPDYGTPIQDANDLAWLAKCPVPLYTTQPWAHVNPRAVPWPLTDMVDRCGGRRYITCTFAMELMTALVMGVKEVAVYGLELHGGTQREIAVEAACVAYWLGRLEGAGITVTLGARPDGLTPWVLYHPYVYGFDYWLERRWVEAYLRTWDERPGAI